MHHIGQEIHTIPASWGIAPETSRLYQLHYGALDVWAMRGRRVPAGYVCSSQALCPIQEIVRTEIYNDFMSKVNIEHGMFGLIENSPSSWASLSLYRDSSSSEFQPADEDLLHILVPHLQRAFRLHFQFSELKARSSSAEMALDMLISGVIFLGSEGEVLFMNRKAEELLQSKDGLLCLRGKVIASVRSESDRLQAMIDSALHTGNGKGLGAGGTILISRQQARPLSVTVTPLTNSYVAFSIRSTAILFISDPDQNLEIPAELLQHRFGLTKAEVRLTLALLQGGSLKEAADLCGVTHNTAKSQLKIIFSKTGVKRQGDLIRLLLTSSRSIRCQRPVRSSDN
jgi:DNA-binding CsgD family transcriptional regulator